MLKISQQHNKFVKQSLFNLNFMRKKVSLKWTTDHTLNDALSWYTTKMPCEECTGDIARLFFEQFF